jgi:FMN-dependent NADH-azoreductase
MNTLLEIESSPMGETASVSRSLTAEYVRHWKQAHPEGRVIRRDLGSAQLPTITAEWVAAGYSPEEHLTPEQKEILALSDTLIGELLAADEYVFGVPMHNFTIPSALRLWIDQVVRRGKTFTYATGTPQGLLKGKKAQFLIASGGVYGAGSAMASYNFVEPYLRTIFGFLGVTETHFHLAGGTSALAYGKIDRPAFLEPHLQAIKTLFKAA